MNPEDYEGSQTELMSMLADHDGPPAYIMRGQRVEQAWQDVLSAARAAQPELLEMPRTRLAQLAALIDQKWEAVGIFLADSGQADRLRQLHEQWQPTLRMPLEPTDSTRKQRAAVAQLRDSFQRYNRRWEQHVAKLSLNQVNYERQEYNNYYLVEKAAALQSERLAAMGFERLPLATTADILAEIPLLPDLQ